MAKIRIVRTAGNYGRGMEFEIDDQVARQLVAEGIAEVVGETPEPAAVTIDDAPQTHNEVVTPRRKSKG